MYIPVYTPGSPPHPGEVDIVVLYQSPWMYTVHVLHEVGMSLCTLSGVDKGERVLNYCSKSRTMFRNMCMYMNTLILGPLFLCFLSSSSFSSSSWFSFSIRVMRVLHRRCSSRAVLDLMNQSNRNCGALRMAVRISS